ncbi:MAG: chromate resistance protein [Proteobacteria bacterium]|nr:chromate resistance protein [Burkholderiales bacterium]
MDAEIPGIAAETLRKQLGCATSPWLIDVRRQPAYDGDTHTLAGALRFDPDRVADWSSSLPRDRQLVAVCVHGHQVSQGVARALRDQGFDAVFLEGGIEHWKVERGATMRRLANDATASGNSIPVADAARTSHWVTRARPKVDRIACPWLIKRFIDLRAQFHFVPARDVAAEAARLAGFAFDADGARFTHRGERCSFDALIEDFELNDAPLARLATIVRGADTGRLDLAAEAPGLLALSQGLSSVFADDHEQLAAGLTLYDALYAYCRS